MNPQQQPEPDDLAVYTYDQWYGGVSDIDKLIVRTSYYVEKEYRFYFGQNLNILDDGGQFSLQPAAVKDSGSIITGLPKWIVSGQPYTANTYIYDANGVIYQRDKNGTYTVLRSVPNSHGQGLMVWNDYLWYVTDQSLGQYGPLDSPTPAFNDAWQTGLINTAKTGFSPLLPIQAGFVVGNSNAVHFYDGVTWHPSKLVLQPGVQIRSLTYSGEFVVFGTYTGASITSSDDGFYYYWDGVSSNFNRFIEMDSGVNAVLNNKNRLLSVVGGAGYLYMDDNPAKKAYKFPKSTVVSNLEIYPGAVTNWRSMALFGVAASTDNTKLVQGIYHWGSRGEAYPEGMNLDYTISTGNTSNIAIGALLGSGNQLFIGWQDNNGGTTYGVDVINYNGTSYSSGFIETTFIDDKRPADDKLALTIKVTHLPLRAGESITLAYNINRGGYITSTANTTVGSVLTRLNINNARFKEFQIKVTLNQTGGTTPYGTTIALAMRTLVNEKAY